MAPICIICDTPKRSDAVKGNGNVPNSKGSTTYVEPISLLGFYTLTTRHDKCAVCWALRLLLRRLLHIVMQPILAVDAAVAVVNIIAVVVVVTSITVAVTSIVVVFLFVVGKCCKVTRRCSHLSVQLLASPLSRDAVRLFTKKRSTILTKLRNVIHSLQINSHDICVATFQCSSTYRLTSTQRQQLANCRHFNAKCNLMPCNSIQFLSIQFNSIRFFTIQCMANVMLPMLPAWQAIQFEPLRFYMYVCVCECAHNQRQNAHKNKMSKHKKAQHATCHICRMYVNLKQNCGDLHK